ncbi:Uncharacterized membrane protein, partial [Mycobacterium numidiamassiliense]
LAARRGAVLWVVAAVGYLILEAVAAAGVVPAYSYARNYISDLGVSAVSPRSYLMQAAFYLQGILFILGAGLIVGIPESPRARAFLGLIGANSIGNIVIGAVHSGNVHRAGAALAIVGGNTAILAGAAVIATGDGWRWYRRISILVAALGLLSLLMLLINSVTSQTNLLPDGMWERASVYSIILWQLTTAVYLLTARRRAAGEAG